MADTTATPRSRPTSMSSQKSASPVNPLVYTSLIFLIAKDNVTSSRDNLAYISDVLKVAGGFSETVDDGYLVENIPGALRDAGKVWRDFYNGNIESDDPFAWPVHALLAEVEAIDFGWESFAESRDEAVANIKEQVESSRLVFQNELDRLREVQAKNRNGTSWKRLGKILLLDDPYESRAHFDAKNFANITGNIQNYISTWRATSIPQLSYRLTSTKRGPTGGLPGKMNEVREKWPMKSVWRFESAPVDELEEVREKAINILKRADTMYGGFLSAIHLLDLAAETQKWNGFGEEHLVELLDVFEKTIRRFQEAEWNVREKQLTRNS